MKLKKLTSIICSVAMALSIFSMPAVANTETAEKYLLINDQFASGDVGGWVQHKNSASNYGSITTTDIGGGNYALLYETTSTNWTGDFIKRPMPGGNIPLSSDVTVVLETKIKLASQGGNDTRLFLKYNLEDRVVENMNTPEYNLLWGTLFLNQKGDVSLFNGNSFDTNNNYYSYPYGFGGSIGKDGNSKVVTGATDNWYTYKLVFHGGTPGANHTATGNTVDFYIYDENGTEVVKKLGFDIDFPDNSTWGVNGGTVTGMNWIEDVIQNFAFKTRSCGKVYVDYFKVWKEGIKVTGAETTVDLRSINVKLTSNDALDEEIAEYIKLYEANGITEVTTLAKNYDVAKKILTFTSETDFPAGNIYKIKIDKAALLADMKYIWEPDEVISVEAPACAVVNLAIKGVLAPGTELEADYDLMPEGSVEGTSVFTWYTVDEQGNTTVISGQTGKTFTVTNDYVDSTITYSVTPKCVVEGVEKTGVETKCGVTVTPLSKPVASNPRFDKPGAMIDSTLSAEYDYYDADGDIEEDTEILWYVGSATDFEDYTQPFATGKKTIKVTEELNGKFIKFKVTPKNNSLFRETGDTIVSDAIGPVADMITASNLFVNSGLESGETAPFTANEREGYRGITIVDKTTNPDGVYEGNYGLHIHPRVDINDSFGQAVPIEANKAYIVSAMLKSANSEGSWSGWEGLTGAPSGDGNAYRPFRDTQKTTLNGDKWVRVSTTFVTGTSGSWKIGVINWGNWSNAEAYADNFYIGELMISDIKTKTLAPITIPLENEENIRVDILDTDSNGNAIVCNQFGEQDGLEGQTVEVRIPDDVAGVEVKNNKLVVNSSAVVGKINVDIVCTPNFNCTETTSTGVTINYTPTPAQSEFVKTIEIELLPNSNKSPQARNVDATGTVYTGATLTGSYDFYQIEGEADKSDLQWVYADTLDGRYKPIPGATSFNYVVTSAYADKFIKFSVTPKTATSVGKTVYSGVLAQATAPEAHNVMVSGDFKIDGTINGTYDYYDVNKDEEGTTTFKWYVSYTENGTFTAIPGANSQSLVLTSDLTDKFIKFGVTPKSNTAPHNGVETFGKVFKGPTAPEARDVAVKVEGDRLIGIYTYYHEHGARELESIYKWTVDGKVVSTEASYVAKFNGVKTVIFTVTPVGDTTPSAGKSVSVSVVVNGMQGATTGNTFGGGGSGGGSSAIAGGVTSINDKNYVTETESLEDNKNVASDLKGHWGESYIKAMEERGVMTADENGKYNPDELVNREDMLTFLFKTLKLEKSEYSGLFEDVADGEFAGMLQTMVDNGTISKDTTFRPGDSISREEMCKILYISLKNANKLVEETGNPAAAFADYDDISDWALPYVNSIYSIQMMIGVSEDRFAPQENVTKAQAATMLTRIISWIEGE